MNPPGLNSIAPALSGLPIEDDRPWVADVLGTGNAGTGSGSGSGTILLLGNGGGAGDGAVTPLLVPSDEVVLLTGGGANPPTFLGNAGF